MNLRIFCLMALLFTSSSLLSVCAQSANDVVGIWFNEEKDAKIQIYRQGDKFSGKIVWLKNATSPSGKPRTDDNNPDDVQRSRQLMGLLLLRDFVHDGGNLWNEGKIYDPKSGKTYSCKMTLSTRNRLDLRGYIGTPLLGRTARWARAE
ncbi:MAG: DUF2147 domain-containing protein [Cytophagaceae bacterium]|nr:DUF2147 domain-containing protein [Cytophagaceae bacterium]